MTISKNIKKFCGRPIKEYKPGDKIDQPGGFAYRISSDCYMEEPGPSVPEKLDAIAQTPGITHLVIGPWEECYETSSAAIVDALINSADRLKDLRALFIGEMVYEQCEISWIVQSCMESLWTAFPGLQHFNIRGGSGLSLGAMQHDRLKSLAIQSGGLDAEVVRQITAARLPSLEYLELWLGIDDYGGTVTIEDIEPLLAAHPNLKYLGLRDSEMADDIAVLLAQSPALDGLRRLETLDLSLGTLTDRGGGALLRSPRIQSLKKLDLYHHYMSVGMMRELAALPIDVDVSERREDDEYQGKTYRYVAVSE